MFSEFFLRLILATSLLPVLLSPSAATETKLSWQTISAGGQNTCGVKSDGSAWCWGEGSSGQIGDGKTAASQSVPAPVSDLNVSGKRWSSITVGISYACGLRDDDTAWCWGQGNDGQLGNGSRAESIATPVPVIADDLTGRKWLSLSAGSNTTCGLRDDTSIWCWGLLDDADADTQKITAKPILAAQRGWRSLRASNGAMCATRDNGSAWCWGAGRFGSLGDGTMAAAATPQLVDTGAVTGTAWTSVVPGGDTTCGLRDDGSAWCWGSNANGALGNPASHAAHSRPVAVSASALSGTRWTSIDVKDGVACGLRDDHSAWCWGRDFSGQLGNNGTATQRAPVKVEAKPANGWREISVGGFHTCAIAAGGEAWCWGANYNGEAGDGHPGIAHLAPETIVR